MKKINIGILSTANIAVRSIIPAILNLDSKYKLAGIASRNNKKAELAAADFNAEPYTGYENLLQKDNLDAVYIPLPNALHFEWIDKALDRGFHILVEKSLACSLDEGELLNKKAREKNLVIFENFQFRFHSQLKYILEVIKSGKLGELRCVRSSFGFPPFSDENNIRYRKALGGGALLDAGAYPIKISQILLGSDLSVSASKLQIDEKRGVDIWGGAFLKQQNGDLFSEIAFGFDQYYQCNVELWGSKGKLFTNRIFTAKPEFKPEIIIETSEGKEVIALKPDDHFKNMLDHFYQLCIGEADLNSEYEQNINQARLISELKEKAEVG